MNAASDEGVQPVTDVPEIAEQGQIVVDLDAPRAQIVGYSIGEGGVTRIDAVVRPCLSS